MLRDFHITDAHHGAAFTVRVITRAHCAEIAGIQDDGSLKIRLTEASTDGRANAQLVNFLADVLQVDPAQIEIVAGADTTLKIISVVGISPSWVEERLVAGR